MLLSSVNAACQIVPADGVTGTVTISQPITAGGSVGAVTFKGSLAGFPEGVYQLTICAFGDTSGGGSSCGPVFDPAGSGEKEGGKATGDLGPVEANAEGLMEFEISSSDVTLTGPHSIIGRSLVITHVITEELPDDAKPAEGEDPSPAPTKIIRKGYGVIGIAKLKLDTILSGAEGNAAEPAQP